MIINGFSLHHDGEVVGRDHLPGIILHCVYIYIYLHTMTMCVCCICHLLPIHIICLTCFNTYIDFPYCILLCKKKRVYVHIYIYIQYIVRLYRSNTGMSSPGRVSTHDFLLENE